MISSYLQMLLTLVQKDNRARSCELLTNFDTEGFSIGLEWCVPVSFHPALDIFKTHVTLDKQTTLKLTQGSNFNFKKGDVLHRKKDGYTKNEISSGQAVQVIGGQQAVAGTKSVPRDCGLVEYELFKISGGKFVSQGRGKMTQDDFVRFLICNQIPKGYERDKTLRSQEQLL